HDFGANLREAVHLNSDVLKGRPERVPEDLKLAATAIDTLEGPSGARPVNFRTGAEQGQPGPRVLPVPGFGMAPHDLDVLLRHRPSSISPLDAQPRTAQERRCRFRVRLSHKEAACAK